MKIPAITLYQAWATMVAIGAKKIETRSWPTSHRGILAIHAAKKWDDMLLNKFYEAPWNVRLMQHGYNYPGDLPFGEAIAVVEMFACVQMTKSNLPTIPEIWFGDYRPGRWMWEFNRVREIKPGIKATGRQGLWIWRVPPELEDMIKTLAPWGGFRRAKEA